MLASSKGLWTVKCHKIRRKKEKTDDDNWNRFRFQIKWVFNSFVFVMTFCFFFNFAFLEQRFQPPEEINFILKVTQRGGLSFNCYCSAIFSYNRKKIFLSCSCFYCSKWCRLRCAWDGRSFLTRLATLKRPMKLSQAHKRSSFVNLKEENDTHEWWPICYVRKHSRIEITFRSLGGDGTSVCLVFVCKQKVSRRSIVT